MVTSKTVPKMDSLTKSAIVRGEREGVCGFRGEEARRVGGRDELDNWEIEAVSGVSASDCII